MTITTSTTRAAAKRFAFTDKKLRSLPPRRDRQYQAWDSGSGSTRGLSVLVSPTGTKSFRAT